MSAHIITISVVIATLLIINTGTADNSIFCSDIDKLHHLFVGNRQPGDRLVLKESVIKKATGWMQIVTAIKSYNTTGGETITLLKALDNGTQGVNLGAYANVLEGGPGYTYVTMNFTSIRGRDIDFIVKLYGLP